MHRQARLAYAFRQPGPRGNIRFGIGWAHNAFSNTRRPKTPQLVQVRQKSIRVYGKHNPAPSSFSKYANLTVTHAAA
jgi:hypothetical protein